MGINFYNGLAHLQPLQPVLLEQDYTNLYDSNSISVKIVLLNRSAAVELGHLEAAVLAPLMDRNSAMIVLGLVCPEVCIIS